jgi:hypothetical protein
MDVPYFAVPYFAVFRVPYFALRLEANTIPVMLVVIGKALNGDQPPRGYRRPVEEVVRLESTEGASPL